MESFFDPLYESIEPLWGVAAREVREFSASWPFLISVRNGKAYRWKREVHIIDNSMGIWEGFLARLPLAELPDVDLAFDPTDEPRLFVPWNVVDDHLQRASPSHTSNNSREEAVTEYQKLPLLQEISDEPSKRFEFEDFADDMNIWSLAKEACKPDTPGRNAVEISDHTAPAEFPALKDINGLTEGYVSDWPMSKSACSNPHIRGLHGSLIRPQVTNFIRADNISKWALIRTPVPLLSSCRMHDITKEIPVPGAAMIREALEAEQSQKAGDGAQAETSAPTTRQVFWRGVASGGINTADTWTHFQRFRLASMLNASQVSAHQHWQQQNQALPQHVPGGDPPLLHNFPLPDATTSSRIAAAFADPAANPPLATWLDSISNVSFTHLRCYPPSSWFDPATNGSQCAYSGPFYETTPAVPATEMLRYTYLPDVDGASWSGRFRALLASDSLPLKATIYDEWHDSRLVPWKHFVPMEVGNADLWGLLEFFLGYGEGAEEHHAVADEIARAGREWAGRVLRVEDMEVYFYRVVLEMARVADERREMMGFVGDL